MEVGYEHGVYNFMHRIGFRRALPLLFILIHLVLVWSSLARQPHAASTVLPDSGYCSVAYQEGGVPIEMFEPPPLKPVQKIALILGLPTMLVATVIGAVLFPRNDMAWLYTSIPLVPLVWYAIGRWLDGLLGYSTRLRLPRILRGFLEYQGKSTSAPPPSYACHWAEIRIGSLMPTAKINGGSFRRKPHMP